MAEIVKDFTFNFSRYQQVVFQRGRVVIDGELNEIGRLERMSRYRGNVIEQHWDKDPVAVSDRHLAVPILKNIIITHSNTFAGGGIADEVRIRPSDEQRLALIEAWGYIWELTDTITLVTTPNATGDEAFQQIYFVIKEVEETAGTEPSIKVDGIGETARRVRLDVEWKVGTINVDAGAAEHNPIQPWDKDGSQAFLVATINRDKDGSGTDRNQIKLNFRQPQEITRLNDRFLPGNVRLRSTNKSSTEGAYAFVNDTGKLVIHDLVVLNPNYESGNVKSFLSALVFGEFTLLSGESLVVVGEPLDVPQFTGAPASANGSEFFGVLDNPGPSNIKLKVIRMWAPFDGLSSADLLEKNYDGIYVVVTRISDEDEHNGVTLDHDYVFADGKRLTRMAETRPTDLPGANRIVWGQGNRWHDFAPPDDLNGLRRSQMRLLGCVRTCPRGSSVSKRLIRTSFIMSWRRRRFRRAVTVFGIAVLWRTGTSLR